MVWHDKQEFSNLGMAKHTIQANPKSLAILNVWQCKDHRYAAALKSMSTTQTQMLANTGASCEKNKQNVNIVAPGVPFSDDACMAPINLNLLAQRIH